MCQNYFIRNLKNRKDLTVTSFENPYPQLAGIHKEAGKYKKMTASIFHSHYTFPKVMTRQRMALSLLFSGLIPVSSMIRQLPDR